MEIYTVIGPSVPPRWAITSTLISKLNPSWFVFFATFINTFFSTRLAVGAFVPCKLISPRSRIFYNERILKRLYLSEVNKKIITWKYSISLPPTLCNIFFFCGRFARRIGFPCYSLCGFQRFKIRLIFFFVKLEIFLRQTKEKTPSR